MKTAIVTGATGFVGIHLITELLANDVDVVALCRRESSNISRLPANVKVVYDITALRRADVFYHLAWNGASWPGRADAMLQARNTEMTLNLLTVAQGLCCGKFVALGTVYEQFAQRVRDIGRTSGSDFYLLSKDYAHTTAKRLAFELKMDFVWCTVCHPIGRYIKPEQLMAYVIKGLVCGEKTELGPAATPYDIIAVEDLAFGLYLLGEEAVCGDYFVGSGKPRLLREYLEEAQRVLGVQTKLGIGERPDDGLRFDESWFDITKIATDTGYLPRMDFAQAVKNVADWVKV